MSFLSLSLCNPSTFHLSLAHSFLFVWLCYRTVYLTRKLKNDMMAERQRVAGREKKRAAAGREKKSCKILVRRAAIACILTTSQCENGYCIQFAIFNLLSMNFCTCALYCCWCDAIWLHYFRFGACGKNGTEIGWTGEEEKKFRLNFYAVRFIVSIGSITTCVRSFVRCDRICVWHCVCCFCHHIHH